jgi:long-subunit acyl-CoA synthetase (AMP-forming)
MSAILATLAQHAVTRPKACALRSHSCQFSYSVLSSSVESVHARLRKTPLRRVGLYVNNSPAWAVLDFALQSLGATCIPLPGFFSNGQLLNAVRDAGIDTLITDTPQRLMSLFPNAPLHPLPSTAMASMWSVTLPARELPQLPADTAKITYTSGTTGDPKGVCLTQHTLDTVAQSLVERLQVTPQERHLALLPLSVLLENVAGLYAPLLAGAVTTLLPLESLGILGATGIDPPLLAQSLRTQQPTSLITLPQVLHVLVALCEQGLRLPSLRLVAVGGAPVSPRLLERAARQGLPVYEGYGLSECGSVVAVNVPGQQRNGSVGRPLPHVRIRVAGDGEILLCGTAFGGYVGGTAHASTTEWPSGDRGFLDQEGYLHITGRKKNMFITSFGRNVAPEWVERELTLHPLIAQAVVFGEGRPWPAAVLVPRRNESTFEELQSAIATINPTLPDYARVGAFVIADEPFSIHNLEYTATGRPRRDTLWQRYGQRLSGLYPHGQTSQEQSQ